jgi:hypothetical protein
MMNTWQWFWTLVGLLIYILVLVFLYFYEPFAELFNLVVNGLSYSNAIFWAGVIIGIVGFCWIHWRAYRLHIVRQRNVERAPVRRYKQCNCSPCICSSRAMCWTQPSASA